MHQRVVNVRDREARWDVYVGRGRCPRTGAKPDLGNPFKVEDHGNDAMALFLDFVRDRLLDSPRFRATVIGLRGRVLGCWCAGRYPVCHGEVLARLADGEALPAIRADILKRLGLGTSEAPA